MTDKKTVSRLDLAAKVYGEDKEKGVLYVAHPVSKEEKQKLVKKGKVIDVIHAPDAVRKKYTDELAGK